MLDNSDKQLLHEMKAIGLRFEMSIERMLPADGSLREDFENWQWPFSRLMEQPGHEMLTKSARDAFEILFAKLTTNPSGRPASKI